jgi:hypothetical protein
MAEKYRRLAEGYNYEATDEGEIIVRERYLRDDTNGPVAVANLPVPGTTAAVDPDGNTISLCLCRRKQLTNPGADPLSREWEFSFSTKSAKPPKQDSASRKFTAGGEIITLEDARNTWFWYKTVVATPAVSISNQAVHRAIMRGSFNRIKDGMTDGEKDTWVHTTMQARAGRINHASWESFAPGQILFVGLDGGDYIDVAGSRRWRFDCQFEYRIVPGAGSFDWNYVWRPDVDDWDRPYNSQTDGAGAFLYATADLSGLF